MGCAVDDVVADEAMILVKGREFLGKEKVGVMEMELCVVEVKRVGAEERNEVESIGDEWSVV